MVTGSVVGKDTKGFGFISPDEPVAGLPEDKDLFFHRNGLAEGVDFDTLIAGRDGTGAKVTFDVEDSPKGLNAVNVALLAANDDVAAAPAAANDDEASEEEAPAEAA